MTRDGSMAHRVRELALALGVVLVALLGSGIAPASAHPSIPGEPSEPVGAAHWFSAHHILIAVAIAAVVVAVAVVVWTAVRRSNAPAPARVEHRER